MYTNNLLSATRATESNQALDPALSIIEVDANRRAIALFEPDRWKLIHGVLALDSRALCDFIGCDQEDTKQLDEFPDHVLCTLGNGRIDLKAKSFIFGKTAYRGKGYILKFDGLYRPATITIDSVAALIKLS